MIILIAKRVAAEKAIELINTGMVVGLGSGTTSAWAIRKIAERIHNGLKIRAVASSKNSEELAVELGIPLIPISKVNGIDITIDGADEVDHDYNLIKGGGGALLREKILAFNSKKFVVIIDESKLVNKLGKFPLPIEMVPFAAELTIRQLEALHCNPSIRMNDNKQFITDNGNLIADCIFNVINEPQDLNNRIRSIPGVVDTGLFIGMTDTVIIGNNDGLTRYL